MSTDTPAAAFYCVADDRFFLGAVGLVNSLRLVGHDEPVYLLDCGLTPEQRERLAAEVTIVPAPGKAPPWLLKTVAPLRHRVEVAVLIDADMIVTRSLAGLIDTASEGRVVAFRDRQQRFFAQWGELLDLGPTHSGPYVSSGLVILGDPPGRRLLELLDDRQQRVDLELGVYGAKAPGYPFTYPEQDVLNAILCSRVEPGRLVALDNRLAPNPPYRGLRLLDAGALRCAYRDGTEPYVVHQYMRKPWLEPTYHGVYSRLLARVLLGEDVAIAIAPGEVPRRMRGGLRARGERALVNVKDFARYRFGDLLPEPIGSRIEARRRRREARQ